MRKCLCLQKLRHQLKRLHHRRLRHSRRLHGHPHLVRGSLQQLRHQLPELFSSTYSPETFESTIDTGGEDTVEEEQLAEEGVEEILSVTGKTEVPVEAEQAPQELEEEEKDMEIVGQTEPTIWRWIKPPVAMHVTVVDINQLVRIKSMSLQHHKTWILSQLKLGTTELEL